jgi:hypothetical protein
MEAETICSPSGEKAQERIPPSCPVRVSNSEPACASHTFRMPSVHDFRNNFVPAGRPFRKALSQLSARKKVRPNNSQLVLFSSDVTTLAGQPLVLRVKAGDWVKIKLKNRIPTSYAASPNGSPAVSTAVGLHSQLVAYDVNGSDGANVGFNICQTIAGSSDAIGARIVSCAQDNGDGSGGGCQRDSHLRRQLSAVREIVDSNRAYPRDQ